MRHPERLGVLRALALCWAMVALSAPGRAWAQFWQPGAPTRPFAAAPRAARPIHPAVVRIAAAGADSMSFGSGTLVGINDQQGLVITNWHVVEEATASITVIFPDGFFSPATLQKVDRDWDLAALAIRRPPAAPVPIAAMPARPGDLLTIAGYGSGEYRAISGRCTQYVAPSTQHPFEMVELAAAARRGDSGGPILNTRGELVGVLFGEGGGYTTGSYCGRVSWFLDSLLSHAPPAAERGQRQATTPALEAARGAEPSEPRRTAPPVAAGCVGARVASLALSQEPLRSDAVQESPNRGEPVACPETLALQVPSVLPEPTDRATQPASTRDPTFATHNQAKLHTELRALAPIADSPRASDAFFDEAKTLLAAVGGVAILVQITRWLSSAATPLAR